MSGKRGMKSGRTNLARRAVRRRMAERARRMPRSEREGRENFEAFRELYQTDDGGDE